MLRGPKAIRALGAGVKKHSYNYYGTVFSPRSNTFTNCFFFWRKFFSSPQNVSARVPQGTFSRTCAQKVTLQTSKTRTLSKNMTQILILRLLMIRVSWFPKKVRIQIAETHFPHHDADDRNVFREVFGNVTLHMTVWRNKKPTLQTFKLGQTFSTTLL